MSNDKRKTLRALLDSTEASELAALRTREGLLDLDFDSPEEVENFRASLAASELNASNHRSDLMVFLLNELFGDDLVGDWDADEELAVLVREMSLTDDEGEEASSEEDGQ